MTSTENRPTTAATTTTTSSRAEQCTGRLRMVLRINAASSMLSSAVMVAIPNTIDDLLDTGHAGWIRLVGLGLMLFAVSVAITSMFGRLKLVAATLAIIAGDIGWVVGSIVTVFFGWYSGGGIVAVLGVAVMVDTYAVLQWKALRQIR